MSVLKITAENFEAEVMSSDKPVLVDFYADWCGPCKMLAPVIEQVADERPDVKVCKVNVDEESALAARFGVMSIPTLVVIKGGEVAAQSLGAKPKGQILALLD
ncbi:MAG: thioredoxin [Clostridia bacterium]|nr:thioredoxin [Clostridia bacterium]